jgi:hypothetical protein
MQKVVGSNPISRLENPCICGSFPVTDLVVLDPGKHRGNTLRATRRRKRRGNQTLELHDAGFIAVIDLL